MSQPRRTAPSSAPTGLPPGPAYVPQAALASERMIGSVLSRLAGRPAPTRTAALERPQRAERTERTTPAQRTLPQSATPRSDEGEATARSDEKPAAQAARRVEPSELLPVTASWTPPGARGGLAAESSAEEGRPLWSALPKLDLSPVVAAVEAQLSERAAAELRERPELTVVSGGPSPAPEASPGSVRTAQRAAEEASARLLDALRAHAAARATASDDRITLGDMTLIAHADSKQQLAAATQNVGHAPAELPLAPMVEASNPKVKPDQHTISQRINRIAEMIRQDLKMAKKIAAERFGVP